jgi:hypothetical protein
LKIPKGQSEAVNQKKDRQYNNQMKIDKQWSTKHYTENYRLPNTNPTKNLHWNIVLQKGKQFIKFVKYLRQSCDFPV